MDDSRVKDVASLLSVFFDQKKIAEGQRYASFVSDWQSIAGERLASHSWVADVDKGVLIVEAEHPGWIQLLQFRQEDILRRASKAYPELKLKAVAFKLGKRGAAASRQGAAGKSSEPAAGAQPASILDSALPEEKTPMPGPFGPEGRPVRADLEAEKLYPGAGAADSPEEREKKEAAALESIKDPLLRSVLSRLKKTIDEDSSRSEGSDAGRR